VGTVQSQPGLDQDQEKQGQQVHLGFCWVPLALFSYIKAKEDEITAKKKVL